jgi:methyltransferase (TIGR00027 family)
MLMQRGKRAKLEKLGLDSPAGHRFVEVDFEHDVASQKLREAGFSTDTPSVFAWLCVTYYLRRESIEASLRDTRTIASTGSWLTCDYRMTDRHLREDERGPVARGDRFFERWGEPMLSKFEPEELHELVARAGWKLVREHTAQDMAERYFPDNRDGLRPTSTYRVVELTPA